MDNRSAETKMLINGYLITLSIDGGASIMVFIPDLQGVCKLMSIFFEQKQTLGFISSQYE